MPEGIKYAVVNLVPSDRAVGGMVMLILPGITYTHITIEQADGTRARYVLDMKDEPEPHYREMFGLPPEPPTPAAGPHPAGAHQQ
jgi:hypothetical protein